MGFTLAIQCIRCRKRPARDGGRSVGNDGHGVLCPKCEQEVDELYKDYEPDNRTPAEADAHARALIANDPSIT